MPTTVVLLPNPSENSVPNAEEAIVNMGWIWGVIWIGRHLQLVLFALGMIDDIIGDEIKERLSDIVGEFRIRASQSGQPNFLPNQM